LENTRKAAELFKQVEEMNVSFWLDNKEFRLNLKQTKKDDLQVSVGEKTYQVLVEFLSAEEFLLNIDGKIHNVIINSNSNAYFVYINGRCFHVEKKSASQILGKKDEKQRIINVETSMPGRIIKVLLKKGDKVKEGEAVLILEAMKMQNEIKSPQTGRIIRIAPKAGESVETGALLFTVE
jgi:biotin carboxyl carrier protein